MAILDGNRETAKKTGLSNDHAGYSGAQSKHARATPIVEIGTDAVRTIVNQRDHRISYVLWLTLRPMRRYSSR